MAAGFVIVLMLGGCTATAPMPTTPPDASETRTPTPVSTPHSSRTPSVYDSGPREGANGSVDLNAQGTPWRYTVTEGDYPDAICYRFNLAAEQLVMDDGTRVEVIYPGDVLRFMPYAPDDRP